LQENKEATSSGTVWPLLTTDAGVDQTLPKLPLNTNAMTSA